MPKSIKFQILIFPSKKIKRAKVACVPGYTRRLEPFIISLNPNIAIFDTPGIFDPEVHDIFSVLKLSLVGAVSDRSRFFEDEIIARLLFEILNQLECYHYIKIFGLKSQISDFCQVSIYNKYNLKNITIPIYFFIY